MRIAHYWAPLYEEPAGITAAVADWSAHQAGAGHEVTLLGDGDPANTCEQYSDAAHLRGVRHRTSSHVARVPVRLAAQVRGQDVLVIHEGYTAHQYVGAAVARRCGVPYVVMSHGVENAQWRAMMRFEPARRVLERAYLRGAAGVHLFFDGERDIVRAVSPRACAFVLPTGVDVPATTWTGGTELLWIGRYSVEHKGLDLLFRALADVPATTRPKVTLRGYDYFGGQQRLETMRRSLGLQDHVTIAGPVHREEKDELLRTCAGWIQPSRWESHSIALLEALSRGVPALISDTMPVSSEVHAAGAARVTPLSHDALVRALGEFGTRPDPELGARARAWVTERFAWPAVMARHDVEYGRIAQGGRRARG